MECDAVNAKPKIIKDLEMHEFNAQYMRRVSDVMCNNMNAA